MFQLVGAVVDRPRTTSRPLHGPGNQPIFATPEVWARIIAELAVRERFDSFNLVPTEETPEQIERFATQVIPSAMALIDEQRSSGHAAI